MTESPSDASSKSKLRRRWWFRGGLALTLPSVVAAGFLWYGWFPNYRPPLDSGEAYGVDVSNHQGVIDWRAVSGDDIGFAYLKATEGGDFVDKRFKKNWDGAGSAGIDRGAYHFFTLCSPGVDQARNFLRVSPLEDAELPPALDLQPPM